MPTRQFAEVPAAATRRLAVAFWMATVEMDKIRSPVSQEAVPWPSASWTMSAATHAMAPTDASVKTLGREGSVGSVGMSTTVAQDPKRLEGRYRTVTFTVAVLRPYWFVE